MDIKSVKINATRGEQGGWVKDIPGMGDLRLHVRSYSNADYQAFMAQAVSAVPREQRQGGRVGAPLIPSVRDAIIIRGTVEHVLLGWDNLTSGGEQIPFSKDEAMNFLADPDFRPFREAVDWAASQVDQIENDAVESVVGNS